MRYSRWHQYLNFYIWASFCHFLATKIKPISFSTIGYLATCITLTAFVLAFIEHQFFLSFDSGFLVETVERIRPKWIGLFSGNRIALLTGNPNTLATILFPIVFLSVVGWRSKSLIWKVLAIFLISSGPYHYRYFCRN